MKCHPELVEGWLWQIVYVEVVAHFDRLSVTGEEVGHINFKGVLAKISVIRVKPSLTS